MPQAKVTLTVRQLNTTISVIDIHGEMNAYAETALMEAYEQANQNSIQTLILNFSGLEYMNSSGIGLLVTLLIRVQRQNQRLLAFGLTEHYQQIFELTRLNEAIGLYPTEHEALKAAETVVNR